MRNAIIIDIDGVLCNVGLDCSPKTFTWEAFKEKDYTRKDIVEGIAVTHSLIKSMNLYPIFLTARPEFMREQTENFLAGCGFYGKLVMTRSEDADKQITEHYEIIQAFNKEKALQEILKQYNVVLAIDDQEKNCDMFFRNGIQTLKAMFS